MKTKARKMSKAKIRKVVINRCHGGFSLSNDAMMFYAKKSGFKLYPFIAKRRTDGSVDFHNFEIYVGQEDNFCIHYSKKPLKNGKYDEKAYFDARGFERDDPVLIAVVEELGAKANGRCADLKIAEIPSDVNFQIDEYDGLEQVEETHRTWV